MKTILVVDDMPIFRDALAAAMQAAGFRAVTASDGGEALEKVRTERPDLVLLDIGMPVVDGLSVLAVLRSEPKTQDLPVILLTALSDKDKVLQAANMGIQDYLLKSRFSLADLTQRVKRRLAGGFCGPAAKLGAAAASARGTKPASPSALRSVATRPGAAAACPAANAQAAAPALAATGEPIPQLLTRKVCLARTAKVMEGKTLSGVVAQVISMAMSPRMDVSQLAAMIGRDPMLSAKVLRVANSPCYASRGGPKTTILDAVRNIGANTVRTIAAALGVFEAMPETAADGYNPIRCWQHSFAVARLCEHFASCSQPESASMAYLVGLCHDLADIMFHVQFGPEYAKLLEWEARTGKPRRELEKAMLGIESSELAVEILGRMGLPEAIQQPIEAWHEHASGSRGEATGQMVQLLLVAELYANGIHLASGQAAAVSPLTIAECRAATGQDHPKPPDAEILRSEVLTLTAMLSRLSAADEAKLFEPLYPMSDRRVCLVRDASLSSCDPIAQAIGAMASVTVMDHVPAADRLREFQSLVVAAGGAAGSQFGPRDVAHIASQSAASGLEVIWLVRGAETANQVPGVRTVAWPTTLRGLAAALGVADADQKRQVA